MLNDFFKIFSDNSLTSMMRNYEKYNSIYEINKIGYTR